MTLFLLLGILDLENQAFPETILKSISKPSTLDGYTPVNKKLLTYPYCYLLASNNSGSQVELHYEIFKSTNCEFSIKAIPVIRWVIKT